MVGEILNLKTPTQLGMTDAQIEAEVPVEMLGRIRDEFNGDLTLLVRITYQRPDGVVMRTWGIQYGVGREMRPEAPIETAWEA